MNPEFRHLEGNRPAMHAYWQRRPGAPATLDQEAMRKVFNACTRGGQVVVTPTPQSYWWAGLVVGVALGVAWMVFALWFS